jgi:hypothetical protein
VWADLFGSRRQVAAGSMWSTARRLGVPPGLGRTG